MAEDFFSCFELRLTSSQKIDEDLAQIGRDQLVCVFLWGHDCPNCEIAKSTFIEYQTEVKSMDIKWLHANIYEDFELAKRFGLFGIPVFLFFRNSKRLGKISPFPGFEPFHEAVLKLLSKTDQK